MTQNKYAIVDEWNYEWLNLDKWHARKGAYTFYATRTIRLQNTDWPRHKTYQNIIIQMANQIINPPLGYEVDHINHNGLDNRECNLRICTRSQNMANTQRSCINNIGSKYRGVHCHKSKVIPWRVFIANKHVGYYSNEIDAAKGYDKAAIAKYGEFATTNF